MKGGEKRMFVLCADKTQLTVRQKEPVTSGSSNAYQVRFEFSAEWDGLARTAVFQAGCAESSVVLTGESCAIPREVLKEPGYFLMAGVCGKLGEELVMPTVWANLGAIRTGAVHEGEIPDTPSGGGTSDHRELEYRDAEGQHPIGAITGLGSELSKRVKEDDAMSVVDIIKIMEE